MTAVEAAGKARRKAERAERRAKKAAAKAKDSADQRAMAAAEHMRSVAEQTLRTQIEQEAAVASAKQAAWDWAAEQAAPQVEQHHESEAAKARLLSEIPPEERWIFEREM